MLNQLSIIIPVHEQEDQLEILLSDLASIKEQAEIIVCSEGTRAKSLNAGALKSRRRYLWFLHADSRVSRKNLNQLSQILTHYPNRLHYFDLAFRNDGPYLAKINAWGANLRSRFLSVPFGDQGFCLSRETFEKIGPYPEDVPYGEDVIFLWRARQAGIKLNRLPAPLLTSARKYHQHGWLKLTLLYQTRWIRILLSEIFKPLKKS